MFGNQYINSCCCWIAYVLENMSKHPQYVFQLDLRVWCQYCILCCVPWEIRRGKTIRGSQIPIQQTVFMLFAALYLLCSFGNYIDIFVLSEVTVRLMSYNGWIPTTGPRTTYRSRPLLSSIECFVHPTRGDEIFQHGLPVSTNTFALPSHVMAIDWGFVPYLMYNFYSYQVYTLFHVRNRRL